MRRESADHQADLVVVGSGVAGLSAALAAGDAGATVLLLTAGAVEVRAGAATATVPERISVVPAEIALTGGRARQQVSVTAHYADKTRADVTHLAMFQSNESVIAAVSPDGRVKAGPLPGEPRRRFRGLNIFGTGPDEARSLAERDPAVRAGQFEIEVLPWLVPAGAVSFEHASFPHSAAEAGA